MERLDLPALIPLQSVGAARETPVASSGNPVYALDARTQLAFRGTSMQEDGGLQFAARTLNWWGGSGVIWCTVLLWLGARVGRQRRLSLLGLRAAEAIAVSSAISAVMKALGGRWRPFLAPGEPWHWSFAHGWADARYFSMPSGHTTVSFAFAVVLSTSLAGISRTLRLGAIFLACGAAAGVAFARVYLDQHWLSDVAAGALLGSVTGWLIVHWHATRQDSAFDRAMLGPATHS